MGGCVHTKILPLPVGPTVSVLFRPSNHIRIVGLSEHNTHPHGDGRGGHRIHLQLLVFRELRRRLVVLTQHVVGVCGVPRVTCEFGSEVVPCFACLKNESRGVYFPDGCRQGVICSNQPFGRYSERGQNEARVLLEITWEGFIEEFLAKDILLIYHCRRNE